MSSIYDKASLVLIPSGTKTSKVYSQKPVNGDGDFTFSRSTAATRVNASGNIEKETQNLLLQSNSFDTTWTNPSSSITGGQSGYDGSSNAWLVTIDAGSGSVRQDVSASGVQTFSVYAKAGNTDWVALYIDSVSTDKPYVFFDLGNGVVGNNVNNNAINGDIEDIGGGWYRCSIIYTRSTNQVRIFPADSNGVLGSTGDTIYIQDAQLEQGLVARDYIETTTAAVEGGITDNVPRLDYTDSSCPALLLEPQRTNLLPNSEYIGSSDWDKNGFGTGVVPVLTFGEESPEGLNNAYEITFNTGAGTSSGDQSNISEGIGAQAAGDYTLSFWAKVSSGTDKIIARGAGGYLYTTCNLTTEWQRFEITENLATAGSVYVDIGLRRGLANEPLNSSVTCQIYGIQMEAGSYATSYIPTYGTSVTRNVDIGYVSSATDIIGQSEGTLFIEGFIEGTAPYNRRFLTISDGGTANKIEIFNPSNGTKLRTACNVSNVVQFDIQTGSILTAGEPFKLAVAYAENDVVMYINGIQIGTDSSSSIPSTNKINFGRGDNTFNAESPIKQALLFKTRLSNEELAALTTI